MCFDGPTEERKQEHTEDGFAAAAAHMELRHLQQLEDAGLRQPDIEDDIDTPHTATFGSRV
jgi:hypothetical protein